MQLLESFCVVVSSNALGHDIVEQMLGKVHFRITPSPQDVAFLFDHISTYSCSVVKM